MAAQFEGNGIGVLKSAKYAVVYHRGTQEICSNYSGSGSHTHGLNKRCLFILTEIKLTVIIFPY